MPATGPYQQNYTERSAPFVFLRVPRGLWEQCVQAARDHANVNGSWSATKEAIDRLASSFVEPEPREVTPDPAPASRTRARKAAAAAAD